jgi:hypothetical protein
VCWRVPPRLGRPPRPAPVGQEYPTPTPRDGQPQSGIRPRDAASDLRDLLACTRRARARCTPGTPEARALRRRGLKAARPYQACQCPRFRPRPRVRHPRSGGHYVGGRADILDAVTLGSEGGHDDGQPGADHEAADDACSSDKSAYQPTPRWSSAPAVRASLSPPPALATCAPSTRHQPHHQLRLTLMSVLTPILQLCPKTTWLCCCA